MPKQLLFLLLLLASGFFAPQSSAAETFRVAAYNVENYLDVPTESRHFVKAADAKAKIRETVKAINPDVAMAQIASAFPTVEDQRKEIERASPTRLIVSVGSRAFPPGIVLVVVAFLRRIRGRGRERFIDQHSLIASDLSDCARFPFDGPWV